MAAVRDVYQRKIYALIRMNFAITRMNKCKEHGERARACAWVNAWLMASGLRPFKLVPKGRRLPAQTSPPIACTQEKRLDT